VINGFIWTGCVSGSQPDQSGLDYNGQISDILL